MSSSNGSQSETEAAQFLQSAVDQYGPLYRRDVAFYADNAQSQGRGRLAHGLRAIVDEMQPGEKVTGAVKPEKRSRWGL